MGGVSSSVGWSVNPVVFAGQEKIRKWVPGRSVPFLRHAAA